EEFVIALPSTGLAGASLVAERIREALSREEILDRTGQSVHVTASFGVAQLGGEETLELLVDRADRAMYGAKSAGRNRVFSTNGASLKPVTAGATAGADEPTSPAAA
ncbi:MAG TPA: diguanylate cyclase, partial [Polyangiaceae bacterium]|nr:diguanylate cyclase [Polyangiaceae bacterium]